jgi:hypothetical protein
MTSCSDGVLFHDSFPDENIEKLVFKESKLA